MLEEKLRGYLNNKEEITMDELISYLMCPKTKFNTIKIGKMMKIIGWHRRQRINGNRYYSKEKALTWEEYILKQTCK